MLGNTKTALKFSAVTDEFYSQKKKNILKALDTENKAMNKNNVSTVSTKYQGAKNSKITNISFQY